MPDKRMRRMPNAHMAPPSPFTTVPSSVYVPKRVRKTAKENDNTNNMTLIVDLQEKLSIKDHQLDDLGKRVKILEESLSARTATTEFTHPSRRTSIGPLSTPPSTPRRREVQESEPSSRDSSPHETTQVLRESKPVTYSIPQEIILVTDTDDGDVSQLGMMSMTLLSKDSMYQEAYAMNDSSHPTGRRMVKPVRRVLPRERNFDELLGHMR